MAEILKKLTPQDIIAILALIQALFIAIITLISNKKLDIKIINKNLDKSYFDEVFKDFLIHTIPEIVEEISFNNLLRMDLFPPVQDKILTTYKKITPYKYLHKEFYDKFSKALQQLEEEIFELKKRHRRRRLYPFTDESYQEQKVKIDEICEELYMLAIKEYRL